jgi:ubiquinone biosynthesis accessory factor UbiJ
MNTLPAPALAVANHIIAQSGWAQDRLTPFAGRVAHIDMPPFDVSFMIASDGLLAPPEPDAVADVTLALPPFSPLWVLQGFEALMRQVKLTGTVDFAEALGFVVKNLRWDAEEDLSRFVGDIAAHRLLKGAREFVGWQKKAAQNAGENLAEYFTEEHALIVKPDEITAFSDAVSTLRDDIARLEKRLARLG